MLRMQVIEQLPAESRIPKTPLTPFPSRSYAVRTIAGKQLVRCFLASAAITAALALFAEVVLAGVAGAADTNLRRWFLADVTLKLGAAGILGWYGARTFRPLGRRFQGETTQRVGPSLGSGRLRIHFRFLNRGSSDASASPGGSAALRYWRSQTRPPDLPPVAAYTLSADPRRP